MNSASPSPSSICPRCGAALALGGMCVACVFGAAMADEAPEPAVVAERVGEYELIAEIARGGMGVVWRARQARLNREVALKFVLRSWLPGEEGARRFQHEAETAAQLRHPHIVTVHEICEVDGRCFLCMELMKGGTLAEQMKAGRMEPRAAAALLAKVARGVQHAHERGILHRDLKPANILLDDAGEPHVSDFGLARVEQQGSALTLSGVMLGTPAYMAPEQAAGKLQLLTTASDTYSLGAILFELLAGRTPFTGDSQFELLRRVMDEEPPRPSAFTPGVNRDLETICLKCLAKDPAARYRSAAALADDLDRWLAGEPIAARPVGPVERAWKWARRHPALAALWIFAAGAAVAGFFVALRLHDDAVRIADANARASRLLADLGEDVFGSGVADRWENDDQAGQLAIFGHPCGITGRVASWSFYDNDTAGRKVTPLVFEMLPGNRYALRGVGTTRTSDASGAQTHPFGLIAGSDAVGPNTTFGFCDIELTYSGKGSTLNRISENPGVVDGAFFGGGPWLFTPTQFVQPTLGWVFTGPTPGGAVEGTRLDEGRVYSAQFKVVPAGQNAK